MAMLQISRLTFGYEGGVENIFENVNLILDTTWRLGLIGRNGKGQTTFLKLLKMCIRDSLRDAQGHGRDRQARRRGNTLELIAA